MSELANPDVHRPATQQPDGSTEGNRTVTYDQAGKQWTITYVNNHATTIQSNSPAAQPAAQGKP